MTLANKLRALNPRPVDLETFAQNLEEYFTQNPYQSQRINFFEPEIEKTFGAVYYADCWDFPVQWRKEIENFLTKNEFIVSPYKNEDETIDEDIIFVSLY